MLCKFHFNHRHIRFWEIEVNNLTLWYYSVLYRDLLDVHWLLCSGAGVLYRVPARDKREEFRTGGGTVHVCQGVEATRHQALMNTLTKQENLRTFDAFIFEVHGGQLLRFTMCLFFPSYPQQLSPDNDSPQHSSRAFQGASVTTQSPQHLREEICDSSVNRFKVRPICHNKQTLAIIWKRSFDK